MRVTMVSWVDRVRKAAREDLTVLDENDRLDFENLLQLLRLTLLVVPVLVLLAYGTPAVGYALAIAAAVGISFGWVALLSSVAPNLLLRAQLVLRLLDCLVVYLVLVNYHAFLHNAYYDSAYLLFVVAAAATHGRTGAWLLSAAAGVAVLISRLQLISNGAFPFEMRHLTDAVFYALLFVLVSMAVAFLMRTSAEVVRRRE